MTIEINDEDIESVTNAIETYPGMALSEISYETKIPKPHLKKIMDNNMIPNLTFRQTKGGPQKRGEMRYVLPRQSISI